jgi:Protein of unknown function (DUF3179)
VVALAVAGCGGGSDESAPSDEELAELADEINKEVPNVGLGEASPPPPDAADWKTDFSKRLVPLEEFQAGGPPKDGIPAIDVPHFTQASDVDWLGSKEPVIEVTIGQEARGYPLQVLIWHEIANDRVAGVPIAVTFCPLCNTAVVFDRRLDGRVLDFGTTGKLRDSDLVMYDRQTESWWQQFSGEALVGELAGAELSQLPVRIVSWSEFLREHPGSAVLDRETGHFRDYGANPYSGYDSVDSSPLFEVRNEDDDRLPPKERVVYVEVGDEAFAIPFSSLAEERVVEVDTEDGDLVVSSPVRVNSALDEASIASGRLVGAARVELDGEPVPFMEPFWFAVAAFRPDIELVDE